MQAETFTPRPSTVAREVMVMVGGINNVNYVLQSVEMYDPHREKFTPLPDIPKAVSWCSVAAIGNNVYVSGGILDGHIVPTVWKFESNKRAWTETKSLLVPRARHASTAWNGKLYVIGGIKLAVGGQLEPVENIDCYDSQTDQWTIVGQSPFPRKQAHLVPFNQTLVELGGTQSGTKVKTMESYLCSDSAVVYSGEQFVLPDNIQYAQIVVLNSIFYIIWEDSKKMISLNPDKRTFRHLADLHYAHIHGGATVLGDKIYVTGGLIDSSQPSRIVEVYDPATNTWTLVKSMRQPRACHGCVTIQMS